MKQLLLCITLMMVAASTLAAQDDPNAFRRFDINWNLASYAHIEEVGAWGGQFGVAFRFNRRIGIVGDFDAHRNNDSITTDLFAYRVGPRLYAHYGTRVTTFGHFVVGGGQIKGSVISSGVTTSQSVNGFSMAWGGGIDVGIKPWFAIRAGQFDYDYFRFQGTTVDGFRVGGGIVFRMGKGQ